MSPIRKLTGASLCCLLTITSPSALGKEVDLFDLPLTELIKIKINLPATLTNTPREHVPAALTHISAEHIRQTSARSLNELLEIFVPGLQYINHRWGFSHLG
ncbi:MAG: hypothetical protein R3208_08845, partial [Ketobacteraceae bacterium]|nr:hypothetical protein [Ketobacteraceae bacterium]